MTTRWLILTVKDCREFFDQGRIRIRARQSNCPSMPFEHFTGISACAKLLATVRHEAESPSLHSGRWRWKVPMNARSLARWLVRVVAVVLLVPRLASADDVHVMISAGFYQAYATLGPEFERTTGHRLITTRGPSMGDSPEAIPTRFARRDRGRRNPRRRRG